MLRLIFSRIGNGVLHLYDNGHILTRTLLPFLLLLAGNLILGVCGVVGILIAAVIDIIAILMLYSSKKDLQQIVDTAVRLGHGDLDLKVDLSDMRTRAGKYEMPVSIYAPTKGYVWAVGEYSVTVDAKAS